MWKPHHRRKQSSLPIRPAVIGGLVLLQLTASAMGQGGAIPKPTTATVRQPELAKDLDAAIQLIEQNDFQAFIEQYCPVDQLRTLRQQDLVERAATFMASHPKTKPQLLTLLKSLKEQSPKFDRSGGLATLQFDSSLGNVEEVPGELNIPETFGLKVTGLGSDLNRVITEATKLLEAGDFSTFVDKLFPASELARLKTDDVRQTLLLQFQETPELAKTMIADLKLLTTIKPEFSEKGTVATFTVSKGGARPRTLKFQKVDANWRLFDDSSRIVTELSRQATLRPGSTIKVVQMERIGGNWRFIELPMLRMDGP
ncbi:MAG: hypothetical protein JSS49_30010 [Planctomycetes bacterium]|nr:hypothetical protein [Planctomycetota bacterium]